VIVYKGVRVDPKTGKPIEVPEAEHFYRFAVCGALVDCRDLGAGIRSRARRVASEGGSAAVAASPVAHRQSPTSGPAAARSRITVISDEYCPGSSFKIGAW